MGCILVVDDERSMREFLGICLKRAGHEVITADTGRAGINLVKSTPGLDLVLTDLRIPGELDGLGVLRECKQHSPHVQVIMVTAFATTDTAITALKSGAYDYLTKPFKVDEITVVVERALERQALVRANEALRARVEGSYRLDSLLGKAQTMQRVFEMVRKVAPTKTNVLVTGESGTGKELVARALHHESPRAGAPFVAVNCGAIPETLLESELFGHEKGAFTGATSAKEGLFRSASGGTLFLDEVGELPQSVQVKLLRALQERTVKPVGGTKETEIDVRLVAATNRDLEAEVGRGAFRQDLYYRLNVIEVHMPPLRRRREDVPLLVEHFVKRYAGEMEKRITGVSADAMARLERYDYPGNVRELENIIERAVALETGSEITMAALPLLAAAVEAPPAPVAPAVDFPPDGVDMERLLADYERDIILKALAASDGVRKQAARLLGVTFRSLRYRLEKLGIEVEPPASGS